MMVNRYNSLYARWFMDDKYDSEMLRGFYRQTDEQADICDGRVAFKTENSNI